MLHISIPEPYSPAEHVVCSSTPDFMHSLHALLPGSEEVLFCYLDRGTQGWAIAAWVTPRQGRRFLATITTLGSGERPVFTAANRQEVEGWWRNSVRGSTARRLSQESERAGEAAKLRASAEMAEEQLDLKNHLYNKLRKRNVGVTGGAWQDVESYRRRKAGKGTRIYTSPPPGA